LFAEIGQGLENIGKQSIAVPYHACKLGPAKTNRGEIGETIAIEEESIEFREKGLVV
jgi:hypothetical protein